jgi:hypothetical protein
MWTGVGTYVHIDHAQYDHIILPSLICELPDSWHAELR